jgi:hypothetical protein
MEAGLDQGDRERNSTEDAPVSSRTFSAAGWLTLSRSDNALLRCRTASYNMKQLYNYQQRTRQT